MKGRTVTGSAFVFACLAAIASPASSAELPPIKVTERNAVPQCATPGRLVAFLKGRNSRLNPRYDGIGTEYMRHGEDLGVRWDIAFFQMMLETGNLTYTGDVKPNQNNFAGLGATGRKEPGESFKDISAGVRAHLQHVLMYTGEPIENPVAERTRLVQEWGVLTKWQKSIKGPMTFANLAKQWAPTTRAYARDIADLAGSFYDSTCKQEDPHPELVAEARKGRKSNVASAASKKSPPAAATVYETASSPDETADVSPPDKTITTGKSTAARILEPDPAAADTKTSKRAAALAATLNPPAEGSTPPVTTANNAGEQQQVGFKVLNSPTAEPATTGSTAPQAAAPATTAPNAKPGTAQAKNAPKDKVFEVASLAGGAAKAGGEKAAGGKAGDKSAKSKQACRVWTASYGGSKAVIIKASKEDLVNYTVLDVNEGAERREAEAYIAAYAKGGQTVGEFPSQGQALDKAFELCPEG